MFVLIYTTNYSFILFWIHQLFCFQAINLTTKFYLLHNSKWSALRVALMQGEHTNCFIMAVVDTSCDYSLFIVLLTRFSPHYTVLNIHDQGADGRSVWAVISSSTKSKENMVVINMYQADENKSWVRRNGVRWQVPCSQFWDFGLHGFSYLW